MYGRVEEQNESVFTDFFLNLQRERQKDAFDDKMCIKYVFDE